MKKPLIAPSILAADWGHLHTEIETVSKAGADWIHIDVMDGHFVPPITFGPQMVTAIKKACSLPLDVHLMIEKPENQIAAFRKAGADIITVHYETCPHIYRTLQQIHEVGAKAGVSVNPGTPLELIKPTCEEADLILIMSVNPGWGGQKFIPSALEKIKSASQLIADSGKDIYLEVDGGINSETAIDAVSAGADVLVAGSFIFGKKDYTEQIRKLR